MIPLAEQKRLMQYKPPHPGEILREFYLVPKKLTVKAAAKKLKTDRKSLSDIVNGYGGISAAMALKLAKLFKTSPEYWMNLQMAFELDKAKKRLEYGKSTRQVRA